MTKTMNLTITSQLRLTRCSDCGKLLQNDDPKSAGYISPSRIQAGEESGICDRCYSLRHYNAPGAPSFGSDYIKILSSAHKAGALIVYVIDVFFLESSIIKDLSPYLDHVLIVLNKADILPNETEKAELTEEAKRNLKAARIPYEEIMMTSSASGYHIEDLISKINELRKGKDVYFIGAAAVGKSSLVNAILRNYQNETDRVISTKKVEGTSLEVMEIPLDDSSSIYDTPGIYNPKSLLNQVERPCLKYLVPRDGITPRVFASGPSQAFIFGNVAVFLVKESPKISYEFRVCNDLTITRAKESNLKKTFDFLLSSPSVNPLSSRIRSLDDFEAKEIAIPAKGNMVITVCGLGQIVFNGANQKVGLLVPKGVGISAVALEKD